MYGKSLQFARIALQFLVAAMIGLTKLTLSTDYVWRFDHRNSIITDYHKFYSNFPDRLKKIYEGLTKIINEYKPTDVAVEEVFYGKNIKAAIKVGEGRGIAILCAAKANIPVTEYAATFVKKISPGYSKR